MAAVGVLVEGRAPGKAFFFDSFLFFGGGHIFSDFGNGVVPLVVGDSLDRYFVNGPCDDSVIICYLPGSVGYRLHLKLFEVGAFLK